MKRERPKAMPACAVLWTIAVIAVMASCSSRERKHVIGVSQCSVDIWRDKLNEELHVSTFIYDNVELRIESANDDDTRQIEQINRFVDEGVDLLIVAPNQISTISQAVDRAYDAGIPVILFDRKTDSDKYTAFIGADNYAIGRTMAKFVAADLGGNGRIVEILGLEGSSPAIERHRGFADEISLYSGISIVDSQYSDWTEPDGENAMNEILDRTADFDYVFCHNDRLADGAITAIKSRGTTKDIKLVGIDALPMPGGGLEKVKNGVLSASYVYPTRGDLVMQLAMSILNGDPYERETYLQSAIVTADNVDVMLLQSDEMAYQNGKLNELHNLVSYYLLQTEHQRLVLLLCLLIFVLFVAISVVVYRTSRMKHRLIEETANAKLRFFTDVSHEFRTPLTLIADPIKRLIEDPQVAGESRRLLQLAQKNVNIMLRLVNEILDLRKAQSKKMELMVTRFNLPEHIDEWTGTFVSTAQKRGVELTTQMPSGDVTVSVDKGKMESICYNLLSNAMKFTPDGGRITVGLRLVAPDRFALSVADTGIGIPQDKLKSVFERFYQVKDADRIGTGIGLALVKLFSEAMGGNVAVESKVGQGTTFTITLPLEIQAPEEISKAPKETLVGKADQITRPEEDSERRDILVVDDNDDIRQYITSLLSDKYNVTCAADGQQGLEAAIREVPDLIVCDVMMPVMDGKQMCRQIKTGTITSHIPVLMLTASVLEEQRMEGYDCGADAYLTKPFSGKVLLSRINNLLANRKLLKDIFGSPDAQTQSQQASPDDQFICTFREKLRLRMADPGLNVETLSADMGLSRVQLYRKVKALTGSTPVELIRTTRLRHAEQLLRRGTMTVAEVSYEVGFSSPSYFIKCYREQFGHTPNAKE